MTAWSPRPWETALCAVSGVLLVAISIGLDAAGLLLVGVAGLFLLGVAASDLLIRPRLSADSHGLTVRAQGRRIGAPWAGVVLRVRDGRRLGAAVHSLEIDIGDDLAVLGRRELGDDPRTVAEALYQLRDSSPDR